MEENRDTIVLATVKRGLTKMIERAKIADAEYYNKHEFHSSDIEIRLNTIRQVVDLIFETETNAVLGEEDPDA